MIRSTQQSTSDGKNCWKTNRRFRFAVLTSHPRSGTTLIEQVLDSHDQLKSADEFDVFTEWIHQPIVRKFPPKTPMLDPVGPRAAGRLASSAGHVLEANRGHLQRADRRANAGRQKPRHDDHAAVCELGLPGNEDADRAPRSARRCAELFHAKGVADADQRKLAFAVRRRRVLRPRDENLAGRPPVNAGAWIEFRYEDVVADLEREARKILDFIGLPWDDKVLKFYEHAREKIVRSPTYEDVTQPVYHKSVGRWKHYARHFEPILETLEPFIKEFGYE